MAARKRASAPQSVKEPSPKEIDKTRQSKYPVTDDPPIAPPKSGFIFKLILFFSIPYLYLIFYHYKIDLELRRSIIINAGLSLVGFFVTLRMIPVASRYVIRRNLFGYDINKRGTPQGAVKVYVISILK